MFEFIKGTIAGAEENYAVLENGGIGYRIFTSVPTLQKYCTKGAKVTFYTYLHLREDVMELYGFVDQNDLNCFRMLLGVSGVGPKMALSMLSQMSADRFALCVVTEDVKSLTQANGVGPKLAKRIVLELKDKIKNEDLAAGVASPEEEVIIESLDQKSETVRALMVLGYSRAEATSALKGLDLASMSVEEAIKAALKKMMQG